MNRLSRIAQNVIEWLNHPMKVMWFCACLAVAGTILDGTAFRLWSLHREYLVTQGRIADVKLRIGDLQKKTAQAEEPHFIERAVRDQFDLVKSNDLVFLFSDENSAIPEKTTR